MNSFDVFVIKGFTVEIQNTFILINTKLLGRFANKKIRGFNNNFRVFLKFNKNQKLVYTNFCNFEHP